MIYLSQDLAIVELGERLGSVDPQLMQQLVKTEKLFESHSEHNYQVIWCTIMFGNPGCTI